MKIKRSVILLAMLSLLTAALVGCSGKGPSSNLPGADSLPNQNNNVEPLSQTYFIFDTVVNVKIYDNRATSKNFEDLETLMKEIDSRISRTMEGSEVSQVNAQSGISPVKVSKETYDLISKALDYAEQTNGRFDPAIGNLVTLWNIGHEDAHVPPAEHIAAALKLSDYTKIQMNEATQEVFLQEKGMALDLGSIGKGYAADRIYDYLAEQGFNSAIIDLGGNIYAMGKKPNGKHWNIGIQDPDKDRGNPIGTIKVEDKTVVTSGIYERYFIEDGKLYQHILNPETGYPVNNSISSVTVVTDRSTDADALSTTLFVLGIEEGLKFIDNMPDTEALFISKDKELYASSGLKELFNKTNGDYTFAN